jgi:ubiquinone/menaquinone biosynthesis C-methylase UbiE
MRFPSKQNRELIESEIGNNPWIPINYSRLLSDIYIEKASVLIIGANSGYEASLFIKDGAKNVVGIDVFTPKIMFKHRKYNFVESAAESLPFLDNQFDIVYSQAVLEHVRDVGLTWEESLRVTKRGGVVTHMASPLWYSRNGHHRPDLFSNYPWCHVGRDLNDWKLWAESIKEFELKLPEIHNAMEYCMNKLNINQKGPHVYSESLKQLSKIEVIQNTYDLDSESQTIPSDVLDRLPARFSEMDLMKITHCGIIKKL